MSEPKCCPFCECEEVCGGEQWSAKEPEPKGEWVVLAEYQCMSCGWSFWV